MWTYVPQIHVSFILHTFSWVLPKLFIRELFFAKVTVGQHFCWHWKAHRHCEEIVPQSMLSIVTGWLPSMVLRTRFTAFSRKRKSANLLRSEQDYIFNAVH